MGRCTAVAEFIEVYTNAWLVEKDGDLSAGTHARLSSHQAGPREVA